MPRSPLSQKKQALDYKIQWSILTLTVSRRKNIQFQKPLSNRTPVPKLLNIWLIVHVPTERWLLLILQTCPNHLSKSPCELRFSRLLLPESHAHCVLIQTGTPDSQVRFGQKGCISKTVVEKDEFIRGPLRGLYEVSLWFVRELAMSFWSGIAPLELALVVKTMSS